MTPRAARTQKMTEMFKKACKKIVKYSVKMGVLAIGCSSVATGVGVHRGTDGEGATVGWEQQRGGWGGSNNGGVFNL